MGVLISVEHSVYITQFFQKKIPHFFFVKKPVFLKPGVTLSNTLRTIYGTKSLSLRLETTCNANLGLKVLQYVEKIIFCLNLKYFKEILAGRSSYESIIQIKQTYFRYIHQNAATFTIFHSIL